VKSFIAEIWSFIFDRHDHPIYQHEVQGWSYVRFWRGLRRGCLPLIALIAGGSAFCCGLVAVLSVQQRPPDLPEDLLLTLLFALIGLIIGTELVRWVTGLLATVLAATTISAEVEAETFGLLRLTPIPVRQIVLAKFGATFRQFRLPMIVIALLRLVFVLGLVVLFAALVVINAIDAPISPTDLPLQGLPFTQTAPLVIAWLAVLVAALVMLAYYLIEPALQVFLFVAVGMLASSLSRTRAGGLLLAGGSRIALWMLSYILGQLVSTMVTIFTFPVMAVPTAPRWLAQLDSADPTVLVTVGAAAMVAWILLVAAAHVAAALGLLAATVRRTEHLPHA